MLLFQDAITDLSADGDPLDVESAPRGFAHRGMLQAARFVENQLSQEKILERAFSIAPVSLHLFFFALSIIY